MARTTVAPSCAWNKDSNAGLSLIKIRTSCGIQPNAFSARRRFLPGQPD